MDMTFKGLSLGDNSNYLVSGIDGWEDRPETTNGSTPHPRRYGSWVGGLSSVKRVVSVDLQILGSKETDWLTTSPKQKLREALAMDDVESPLLLDLGYGIRPEIIFARCTAFSMPTVRGYGRIQTASIEFTAADPRRYSVNENTSTTGLPVKMRGSEYPIPYGRANVITPSNRGEAIVQNVGNASSPASYKIVGPVKNPTITVAGAKDYRRRIQFNLNLAAGETLVANPSMGTITVDGVARRGVVSGALLEDMEIPPGNSTVTLGGTGSTAARLTVSWRDANL